jgi:hypothetical protein
MTMHEILPWTRVAGPVGLAASHGLVAKQLTHRTQVQSAGLSDFGPTHSRPKVCFVSHASFMS